MADQLSSAPQAGHNGVEVLSIDRSDLRELLDEEEGLKERRRALSKASREHKEKVEKHGIPLPAWGVFVKVREEPGSIRQRNFDALDQLLQYDNKPRQGIQLSMDLDPSQGSPELTVADLKRIDTEGFEAGKAGKKRSINPYTPTTEAAQRFDTAWLRGQSEIASTLANDPPAGAENANGARRRGRPSGSKNKPKLDVVEGSPAPN